MGRKLKPLQDRSTNTFNFQYPLKDPKYYGIMEKAYTIIKRENITFDQFCVNAVQEYVSRHFDGNYQTLLASYESDGVKSEGQQEQELVRYYMGRAENGFDLRYIDINTKIREKLGYEGSKTVAVANRVTQRLYENGVKVWR